MARIHSQELYTTKSYIQKIVTQKGESSTYIMRTYTWKKIGRKDLEPNRGKKKETEEREIDR